MRPEPQQHEPDGPQHDRPAGNQVAEAKPRRARLEPPPAPPNWRIPTDPPDL
jgi:hypothetical protein